MKTQSPTPAETLVLQVLWDRESATAPEIHAQICLSGEVTYTTVLKRIQRMEDKELVRRLDKQGRAHRYQAVGQPRSTRTGLMQRLIENAFDDSPNALIQHAIRENELSADDIQSLRHLLDEIEGSGQ